MSDFKTDLFDEIDSSSPSVVVVRDPEESELEGLISHVHEEIDEFELEDALSTPHDFIMYGLDETEMNKRDKIRGEWSWEMFQQTYFKATGDFITNKCRQSGFSLAMAAKFMAKGILSPMDYNAIFASYKKEEATNKIDYVRNFLQALPPSFKKKVIRDPHHLIEFRNANGTRVKIISHAQKPIRGINGDIGLDELAFFHIAKEVYESSKPATGAVRGTIDVVSTPFGKSGTYYELFTNEASYRTFTRHQVMWWHCRRYLKDPNDAALYIEAIRTAPYMTPQERVMKFGSKAIQDQFFSLSLEIFRQEFEGYFIDAAASFMPKDLITSCMYGLDPSTVDEYEIREGDFSFDASCPDIESVFSRNYSDIEKKFLHKSDADGKPIEFKLYSSIEELEGAISAGAVSTSLVGGADVGTSRHHAHFVIFEDVRLKNGETLQIERFRLNKSDWMIPDQQDYYEKILRKGFLQKMGMDTTGLGTQMGQYFSRKYPTIFRGYNFSGGNIKMDQMMTSLKLRLERLGLALYNDKVTLEDLYSIQRVINANRSVSYRASEKKRHHGDAAWAIAIASDLCAGTEFISAPRQDSDLDKRLEELGLVGYTENTRPPKIGEISGGEKTASAIGANSKRSLNLRGSGFGKIPR